MPLNVDWRTRTTSSSAAQVRDQGSRGICWLVAGANALEYAHRILNNLDININVDNLLEWLNWYRGGPYQDGGHAWEVWECVRYVDEMRRQAGESPLIDNDLTVLGMLRKNSLFLLNKRNY